MLKTLWSGLIPVVAAVALWAPAAQANWTCDDQLQSCLSAADAYLYSDLRVWEMARDRCFEEYDVCQSSSASFPEDSGANHPDTVERNDSSSEP